MTNQSDFDSWWECLIDLATDTHRESYLGTKTYHRDDWKRGLEPYQVIDCRVGEVLEKQTR